MIFLRIKSIILDNDNLSWGWGIVKGLIAEGAYCLQTTRNGLIATLTRTLANLGQIKFYCIINRTITFYIDDVLLRTNLNGFWGLHSTRFRKENTNLNGNLVPVLMEQELLFLL